MGLDLRLLPIEHDSGTWGYSHSVLNCDRDYDLFDAIAKLEKGAPGERVPQSFSTFLSRDDKYEESHYGDTQDTPYGEPLRCVRVSDLLTLRDQVNGSPQNRATWAYLAELPSDMRVALYWH